VSAVVAATTSVTASSSVVLSNLAYLIGAVLLAIIFGLLVWLRHRKPKSIDANVESFNRGLRALAPDREPPSRHSRKRGQSPARTPIPGTVVPMRSVRVAPIRTPQVTPPPPPEPPEPAGERAVGPEADFDGRPGDAPDQHSDHAVQHTDPHTYHPDDHPDHYRDHHPDDHYEGPHGAAAEAPGEHAGAEPG
jgi:hypothetical protein